MHPSTLYTAAFGVGTTLALLAVLRVAQRVLKRDFSRANEAWRLAQVGEVLAVFLVAASIVKNCVTGEHLLRDLRWAASYGALGVALVLFVGELSTRTLFRSKLSSQLERNNMAAGLAASAHYAATGILASHAMAGTDLRGLGLALAFFALAVVTHGAFVSLFRALTSYDDEEQISGENLAASISYAGITVSIAVLVARGVEGDFTTWSASLKGYFGVAAYALALYPVRQLVVQGLLLGSMPTLRGGALDEAISQKRNEGMATLEAGTYLATALAIARMA